MTRTKPPCPKCGRPMSPTAEQCRKCKPSYRRTPEHRALMSASTTGVRHDWPSASTRPEVAAKIAAWWTPERRETRRREMLAKNPDARYHGLPPAEAARIVRSVGSCQRCLSDGSDSRLGVHHKDRDKKNQASSNLEVLCHRCHMQEHKDEIGWAVYRRKHKTTKEREEVLG
jgi:5-methylcytosine-specific restriction endonuclease McrA